MKINMREREERSCGAQREVRGWWSILTLMNWNKGRVEGVGG